MSKTPYQRGWDAFLSEITQNPYPSGSEAFCQWAEGWLAAYDAEQKRIAASIPSF